MELKQKLNSLFSYSEKYLKTDVSYVLKGGFWIVSGKAGTFLISVLIMLAFSHFVPKEVYGTYQYIVSIGGIFAMFALPGIDISLIRSMARGHEGTLRLAVKEKLKFSAAGTVLLSGTCLWYFSRGETQLATALLIAAVFLPFQKTFPVFESFWLGRQEFKLQSKYHLLSAFFSAAIIIPAIYLTEDSTLIILAFFLSHSLFDGIFLGKTLMRVKNASVDGRALPYGKHLTLMSVPFYIAENIDKIILWKFLGPVGVAVYSFAYLPVEKIKSLSPVSSLSLPKISKKNIKDIKPGITAKFKKLMVFAALAAAAAFFAAPYLYELIFPRYIDSIPYFRGLSLIILYVPFQLLRSSLLAEEKQRELYIINVIAPSVKIILLAALAPVFHIWGAVLALLASYLARAALTLYYFTKI